MARPPGPLDAADPAGRQGTRRPHRRTGHPARRRRRRRRRDGHLGLAGRTVDGPGDPRNRVRSGFRRGRVLALAPHCRLGCRARPDRIGSHGRRLVAVHVASGGDRPAADLAAASLDRSGRIARRRRVGSPLALRCGRRRVDRRVSTDGLGVRQARRPHGGHRPDRRTPVVRTLLADGGLRRRRRRRGDRTGSAFSGNPGTKPVAATTSQS